MLLCGVEIRIWLRLTFDALPMLGAQLGVDLDIIARVIEAPTDAIIRAITQLTGNS
jgi:hypothetical protein